MDKTINLTLFGLILLSYDLVYGCNITAVNLCTSILSRGTDVTVLHDGISAIPSETQLRKMCGSLDEFKTCYMPKAELCKSDVVFSMTFGTIENTINYLCIEGYADILRYATCWDRSEVTNDTTSCHVQQNEMIAELKNKAGQLDQTVMRQSWCQILDNTTSCMSNAVDGHCGAGPACVMHTMMSRALTGLAGLMGCPTLDSCNLPGNTTVRPTTASTNPTQGGRHVTTPSNNCNNLKYSPYIYCIVFLLSFLGSKVDL